MNPTDDSPIDVAAAIVFQAGRLLIAQRPAGSHLAELWEFPGGKREPHETWEECLRRELREELEVDVEVGELFEEIRFAYPGKSVRIRFFLARLIRGEPKAVGCADLKWVRSPELADYAFPPADAALIQKLVATNTLWSP